MAHTKQISRVGPQALATWQQELAAEAKADAAQFAQGLPRISFRSGRITMDGAPVQGDGLPVVILGAVHAKAYYLGAYDADVPQTPVCYAFHPVDYKLLAPHEAAPEKQGKSCAECVHNRFGTSETGKGKRCKDELRLVCIVPGPDFAAAEVRLATIPPSSLSNWSKYLSVLRDRGLPYRAVVTQLSVVPAKTAFRVDFDFLSELTEEQYLAARARREAAVEQAMQPYPVLEQPEQPEQPARQARGRRSNRRLD